MGRKRFGRDTLRPDLLQALGQGEVFRSVAVSVSVLGGTLGN